VEALNPGKDDESHGSTPRKYSAEARQRATRMAMEAVRIRSRLGGDQAGCRPAGGAPRRVADLGPAGRGRWRGQGGYMTDDAGRLVELEREVRELRRANEILKTSAASFAAAELNRRIR